MSQRQTLGGRGVVVGGSGQEGTATLDGVEEVTAEGVVDDADGGLFGHRECQGDGGIGETVNEV